MNAERDDADLRAAFQRLRRQDETLGRPFVAFDRAPAPAGRWRAGSRVAGRPAGRVATGGSCDRPRLRPLLAAAALACVLAAAVGTVRWLLPAPPRRADATAAAGAAATSRLSSWRAPTDALLDAPGGQLLRGVPRLADSVVGGNRMTLAGPEKLN
jgi:ferric-dicitrate binding protein FerR (iron transport regulator)